MGRYIWIKHGCRDGHDRTRRLRFTFGLMCENPVHVTHGSQVTGDLEICILSETNVFH